MPGMSVLVVTSHLSPDAAAKLRGEGLRIAHLNDLKTQGVITGAEFETAKAKALAS